jgi:peptidyl-prolyl cis-trans isomerase C
MLRISDFFERGPFMDNPIRSRLFGTSLASIAIVVAAFTVTTASAETIATINGVKIDDSTFEFYLENRTQKPSSEITDDERASVLQELKDIYILTTLPRAAELSKESRIKAQIELQYRATLAQAVASDWLASNPASEEEIQQAYSAQTLLAPDLQFKARHILVETQSAAIDLITQLDAGANFEELAQSHSTGPSGPAGGDLGWFSPNQMVTPFSDAVARLINGTYTKKPVQTQFGWHVILREDSRNNEPPPLDSVRDTVKQNVEQTNFQNYLEGLRTSETNQS